MTNKTALLMTILVVSLAVISCSGCDSVKKVWNDNIKPVLSDKKEAVKDKLGDRIEERGEQIGEKLDERTDQIIDRVGDKLDDLETEVDARIDKGLDKADAFLDDKIGELPEPEQKAVDTNGD